MPGPWHLLSKGSGHCQQHNRGPQPDSVTPDQGKGKVCVWVWVSPVPECTCRIHSPVNSVCPCPCPALGSGQDGRRGAITTLVLTGALTEGEAGRVARQKCCALGRAFVHGGAAEVHRGCSPGSGGCINHRNETLGQAVYCGSLAPSPNWEAEAEARVGRWSGQRCGRNWPARLSPSGSGRQASSLSCWMLCQEAS